MTGAGEGVREGSLEAPTRHPLDWKSTDFWDEEALNAELERVFDICHGCRRCVSLCHAFPTLFDLVDESPTLEVDGIDKQDYIKVVEHCYLCDLCYMTKCPYVPPHEWQVDFPHLMLRAKAVRHRKKGARLRDRVLSSTDTVGRLAGIPVITGIVNAANSIPAVRSMIGVHPAARVPTYHSDTLRKRIRGRSKPDIEAVTTDNTRGKVILFTTCYGNYNEPELGEDLIAVFEHNGIPVSTASREKCCGMPKLELGDLDAVARAKDANIPGLVKLVDEGWDIVAPISSCVLMFKSELPLMFPDDADVQRVSRHIFDPFEYLMLRHKAGKLNTDFSNPLGKVAYHVACHQRVQNIGMKTRDILQLIPDTEVQPIERCSGHDGTYAVKKEYHEISMKIVRPVANRVKQAEADFYTSDCPMAGQHIGSGLKDGSKPTHPMALMRRAYGI
jgi:Fe-S oxidoreductase